MQRITLLLSLLIVCFATATQAQTTAPKPDPALKQLHGLLGHWTYTCEYQATPLGPASKTTGEATNQMILGGFFVKVQWTEKAANGALEGLEVDRYDPESKKFAFSGYQNDGTTYSGTFEVKGADLKMYPFTFGRRQQGIGRFLNAVMMKLVNVPVKADHIFLNSGGEIVKSFVD